ncbi:MAG: hypothetical protein K6E47_08905 [Lachnospiraceae bacterium]|nr:hypothetical protein [Lachnospiraceae bacterium]
MEQEIEYKFILSDEDRNDLEVYMAVALISNLVNRGDISKGVLDAVKKDAKNLLKKNNDYGIL